MITKPALDCADVEKMLAAAQAEARRQNWAVTIAVVDDGGHLQGLLRLDGAPVFSVRMATEKARSAALGRRETKVFEEVIAGGRLAFLTAPDVKGLLEGGLPIMVQGQMAGAIGVSGVKSSEDAQVGRAAIAALNL